MIMECGFESDVVKVLPNTTTVMLTAPMRSKYATAAVFPAAIAQDRAVPSALSPPRVPSMRQSNSDATPSSWSLKLVT